MKLRKENIFPLLAFLMSPKGVISYLLLKHLVLSCSQRQDTRLDVYCSDPVWILHTFTQKDVSDPESYFKTCSESSPNYHDVPRSHVTFPHVMSSYTASDSPLL